MRSPGKTHKLPKQVWDDMVTTVHSLDKRVNTIEKAQRDHRNLLRAAIALIPVLTAAIVTVIEAIK